MASYGAGGSADPHASWSSDDPPLQDQQLSPETRQALDRMSEWLDEEAVSCKGRIRVLEIDINNFTLEGVDAPRDEEARRERLKMHYKNLAEIVGCREKLRTIEECREKFLTELTEAGEPEAYASEVRDMLLSAAGMDCTLAEALRMITIAASSKHSEEEEKEDSEEEEECSDEELKHRKWQEQPPAFANAVHAYYKATRNKSIDNEGNVIEHEEFKKGDTKESYCHLTGWWLRGEALGREGAVKCAHLVPKFLFPGGARALFGSGDLDWATNPRNGITLHRATEEAMDAGRLAIIPVVVKEGALDWKLVLADPSLKGEVALLNRSGDQSLYWDDLTDDTNGANRIKLLTANRPGRRFVYFRFVITYLKAKARGWCDFTRAVEHQEIEWALPGKYLEKSALVTLAKYMAGTVISTPTLLAVTKDDEGLGDQEQATLAQIVVQLHAHMEHRLKSK